MYIVFVKKKQTTFLWLIDILLSNYTD